VLCLRAVQDACKPLGIADVNKMANDKITSSSVYYQYYPYKGRLHGKSGWCPQTTSNRNDFTQVDMGAVRSICAVATQGKKNGSYVTSYKLLLSSDGVRWTTYQEQNVDKVTYKFNVFIEISHRYRQRRWINCFKICLPQVSQTLRKIEWFLKHIFHYLIVS